MTPIEEVLSELERKAEASADLSEEWTCLAGTIEDGGRAAFFREHRLCDDDVDGECAPEDVEEERAEIDAAFGLAANPATVLKLVEVAKAAIGSRAREPIIDDRSDRGKAIRKLDAALSALASPPPSPGEKGG